MDKHCWIIMPVGGAYGWGVCGKHLAFEMSGLTQVNLVSDALDINKNTESSHFENLSALYQPVEKLGAFHQSNGRYAFDRPVLQTIQGNNLKPWLIEAKAPRIVGYTFFEDTALEERDVSEALEYFDWIVAGSSWCEKVLRHHRITRTSTILQGVDSKRFHPGYAHKDRYKDKFVIFSGGKIEFRKGQDLVIRAFKVLQDKYDDVLLVNCWYNRWDTSVYSMSMSPHITFEMPAGDYFKAVNHLLSVNGIDLEKVITLPPIDNAKIAQVYRDSDCGLFPNRCEGGTNLVMMEYMACGKPVIASDNTGHSDVLSDNHAVLLKDQRVMNLQDPEGRLLTTWYEPNLDEIVHHLEWAYENRDKLKTIGSNAGTDMKEMTWKRAATQFLELLNTKTVF